MKCLFFVDAPILNGFLFHSLGIFLLVFCICFSLYLCMYVSVYSKAHDTEKLLNKHFSYSFFFIFIFPFFYLLYAMCAIVAYIFDKTRKKETKKHGTLISAHSYCMFLRRIFDLQFPNEKNKPKTRENKNQNNFNQ